MNADDFSAFFKACWGDDKPPFAWQIELARRVLAASREPSQANAEQDGHCQGRCGWPDAVVLPTAAGKTACMDIAVFALAAQADRLRVGEQITAPRRIFFVVDRRVIVDEAYERAQRLARKLKRAQAGILKTVADNLRRVAAGPANHDRGTGSAWPSAGDPAGNLRPLSVHVLRGGMYRSEAWARSPLQPTIVASTVDQVGSRLLFRAYGRGSGTWPIYAGLVANDSLIFLDEAHCAQPFLRTLQAVDRFRGDDWAESPLKRSFQAVVMSATPPPGLNDVFEDRSEERRNPDHPLGRRQRARKPADLRRVAGARDKKVTEALSKALVDEALDLINGERRAIVVFANWVATAREAYRRLQEKNEVTAILLTGRMRPLDKDLVLRHLRALGLDSHHSDSRVLEKPVVVVATQTLEVGADLDFDGLVTECASLDALRQRFGRLNRMGRKIRARGCILIRGDQDTFKKRDRGDPIYGKALTCTWEWLQERRDEAKRVDFGIANLDSLLCDDDAVTNLVAPSLNAPVMLPSHVDCWAQTAPAPEPTPEVSHFLRGSSETAPDVQVCWRADLDLKSDDGKQAALESLALCPPSSVETLPVPIRVAKRWLAGEGAEDRTGDVEGVGGPEKADTGAEMEDSPRIERRIVRWRGSKTKTGDITSNPRHIRPGDVVVIPTACGSSANQLGDLPQDDTSGNVMLDIGDQAHRLARAKPIIRLHPAVVAGWPEEMPGRGTALALLEDIKSQYEEDPADVAHAIRDLLAELAAAVGSEFGQGWFWLPQAARELRDELSAHPGRFRRDCRVVGKRMVVVVGRRRIPELMHGADTFGDEDDATASGTAHSDGRPVTLATHLRGVERFARMHAVGCGLPQELAEAVARAGRLHDLGKADPRFQALLSGGSRWHSGTLLAKSASMPHSPWARRRAREAAGYPAGGPHALLSVRLAESVPERLPEDDDLQGLVLHLVASHHGQCRPFAPVVVDPEPREVSVPVGEHVASSRTDTGLERLDSGVADRYWRLTRRYGWWGLAWLEALLRLADWRQSEWEEATNAES